jgi:DnaA-homolog protein
MKQLLLELHPPQTPTLANFSIGQNQELLHVLQQFAARTSRETFLYLWGTAATGKTHLLQALAAAPDARLISANQSHSAEFNYSPETQLYLLDNCELLNEQHQIDAFALFNQIRERGGFLISSAAMPPAILPVREDFRTRMGWGLIYQLHPLTDADKISALQSIAQARDWRLASGVIPYLITHYRRDMRSLTGVLEALDNYSLETKRPMNLPLLRDILRTLLPANPNNNPTIDNHESGAL